MEAQLVESGTIPSQEFAKSFFYKLPTDSRFLQTTFYEITPSSSIDSKVIEFNFSKFEAGNIYMIQETYVKLNCVIVDSKGKVPTADKVVSTVNNLVHSLFESVRLYVNDQLISTSPNDYPYKAYISNLLTFPPTSKTTALYLQGYANDTAHHMGPTVNNLGFVERNKLFRKKFHAANDYRPEGTTLIGKLYHELSNITTGLPPGVKVKIELIKNTDEFVILQSNEDTEKYKIKITNISLFVPVAQIAGPVYSELSTILSKPESEISFHYRRIEIKPFTISKNTVNFQSTSLFPDSNIPCRIVVAFVNSTAKIGSRFKNPFDFVRSWEVDSSGVDEAPVENQEVKKIVEDTFLSLNLSLDKKLQEAFMKALNQKGTGRTTRQSAKNNSEAIDLNNIENLSDDGLQRLKDYISQIESSRSKAASDTTSVHSYRSSMSDIYRNQNTYPKNPDFVEPRPSTSNADDYTSPPLPTAPAKEDKQDESSAAMSVKAPTTKKTIYIKKVDLTINNSSIDQLEDDATEDQSTAMFFRLFHTTGQLNTLFSCGIEYQDFLFVY